MKKIYVLLLVLFCSNAAFSQMDTVLWENFQFDNSVDWGNFPFGNDTVWINLDEDGLNPSDFDDVKKQWFYSFEFRNAVDTVAMDTNFVLASHSWMEGYAIGNRNWFITPPVTVTDNSYVLSWKSAPLQMPRYMDGYLVLAGPGSNDILVGAFTDTLFQAASMEAIVGVGGSLDPADFAFTAGYVHGNNVSDPQYFELFTPGDSTLYAGLLEPHSVSLSDYIGQTVYFAFLHNSDDDNEISIDDILMTRLDPSSANDPLESSFRFVTYPNPVDQWMNVLYRLPESMEVSFRLYDMNGKVVRETTRKTMPAGDHQFDLFLQPLPAGMYNLSLQAGQNTLTRKFVKR